ncbi:DNA-3-methyladenine glycosylase [Nigerium massiliense]|uniref:DNA-3-methyladenine glycosylase n=1 Tax=Nigerium massiliense TaxID=1522317 RepID=UPI00069376CE|nr:DNA-3-methyladenine glycosylase [Nigerium massiliense]
MPVLSRPALDAAPALLGCLLRVGDVAAVIVEVEAYEGEFDPASHAWRGPTRRNEVMFGPAGRLYVYQMHGHHCCNVVCGPEGRASAVLLRAGSIVAGAERARERRGGVPDAALGRGPGNLCRALGITAAHNGAVLGGPEVVLEPADAVAAARRREVASGPRVNVSRAADRPWRFWLAGDPAVSAFKPHRPKQNVSGS